MASTADLCKIITDLGGNPEALSDKRTKTLSDEIIRLLTHKAPTANEVVLAIQSMTTEQKAAVNTALSAQNQTDTE